MNEDNTFAIFFTLGFVVIVGLIVRWADRHGRDEEEQP